MRAFRSLLLSALVLAALTSVASTQSAELRILEAGPRDEINQLQDANEIRIVFSEPMVALGRVPSNPVPSWIRIAPAIAGTYRWSGTTILILTPDPATPLPYSTRYTVAIDAAATSAAGRRLGTPYTFTFTTPTVKLESARWYRRANRFDQPAVIVLDFNQPMRPADVLSHVTLRHLPHDVEVPALAAPERARLTARDAEGLRRFDAKVAAARATARRTDVVAVRVTADWDRQRFPASDSLVVLETTTAPPPGSWLQLVVDNLVTGAQGTVAASAVQRSTVELDPLFFVTGFACRTACDPSRYNAVEFSVEVGAAAFAPALSVQDITEAAKERPIARAATARAANLDQSTNLAVEDAGYDRQPPARTFAYSLPPTLQAADGQPLGYSWVGIVENWHERAFTSFGDGHGVWETGGGPLLPFYARNFRTVTQWMTRLLPSDLMPRILALSKGSFNTVPPGAGTLRKLGVTADQIQSHGLDLKSVLSPSGTGLVWAGLEQGTPIERSSPIKRPRTSSIVQVTNLGISVKDSPQSTLVFVTRLDNGEAVADARVAIINTDNKELWRGTTSRDGIAMAPALPLREPDDWYQFSFIVTAEKDGDIAYVGSDWNEGIQPWDFSTSYQLWEATDILRGSVFSDRGVYKPGEQVHVKAIVRADTPTGVRMLPAGSTIDVRVNDGRGREVDRRSITLSRWSSAEWTWTVPADATLGNYAITAMLPGTERPAGNDAAPARRRQADWLREVNGSFLVAAYRRPDFRVDATLSASEPIAGARLLGTIDARYLFGGAMGRRPVRWTVTREPELVVPAAIREKYPEDRFAFGYYPRRDQRADSRVAGATATLDAAGRLSLDVPSEAGADLAYRYTLEGDVEDVSRQHIANRASLVIHAAPFYVGMRRPDFFATTTSGTSVDVVAADLKGVPVAGLPVTVSLIRVQWNSVRHAEGSGFYTWQTERLETPAGEWTVTSAASPVPVTIPIPEGGSYVIRAVARDASGRTSRTEASFYGLGRGYTAWERFDHNRITLEPEKKTWKPGETARIMIQSPWDTATALLTVEREGIRRHQRFALTSTQQTVEVPITEDDIPNVFVSVLLIRGRSANDPGTDGSDPGKPSFRLGYAELKVEDATKRLAVKVSADRAEYRPANTAKVTVDVSDAIGRPAASEVTLWAVDYGVLSLTEYREPDVMSAVYQEKALQVMNADSRQRIVSRRVLTPKGADEGGGGGDDGGAGNFRRDFRPLAFWLGSVETDASGRATRDVKLPESLTTYKIMAVAGDAASRFGSASAEFKVNKPVTLLTAFPRFLSQGDRAAFGAIVSNTLATGGGAVVTIRSLDPAILQMQGGTSRTIQLAAGSTEPVRFEAMARSVGTARVQMTVRLGNETDSFETTLAVSAPAPIETSAAFGDTDSRTTELLTVPAGVVPGIGGLNVELSSTALVGLGEGARYLADYPYGCGEQKASAALALVLAADLGAAFSMGRIAPAEYRTRAGMLLAELPRYQCSDGGFGYWPGSCRLGHEYLTAYILHVMKVAAGLGFAPDANVVNPALDFLEASLRREAPRQPQWLPAWSASSAFSVKVLTEYGRNQDSNITRLTGMVDRLPIFALSYLADAIATTGQRGARYDDVVRRITNAVRVEGDRAHVEETDSDALAWLWNSNVRATSLVLEGFVRRGDDPVFVQRLVRWILAARVKGRWANTQDNATALESLVGYYKKFEAEPPNMTASVAIGSRTVGTAAFRGRSSTAESVRLAMPDLLRAVPAGAERELAISRAGTGRVFYTSRLQFALATPPPAQDDGIRVERRYERFVETGPSPAATAFSAGDLIRVTLTLTLPKERRFVAVTDALPAGMEAVDSWFRTTASDLARDASVQTADRSWEELFRGGGFDHVEKYDDRVSLFATRLGEGRHEFSYLVRATTTGTFQVTGTTAEEMYAPEVKGRSAPVVIEVR